MFRVALNGTVTVLHEFGAGQDDFRHPLSGLTQGTDGALYGSTSVGTVEFTANRGAAFRMTLEGSLTFLPLPNTIYSPIGRLVPTGDGDFYGTTQSLHLFRMTPDGAFTVVHAFNVSEEGIGSGGDLLLASDGNIYGTTRGGGIGGGGTIFSMTPSGEVTILHSFFFNDLNPPWHSLSEPSPGMIYGTTTYGGAGAPFGGPGDKGTIFRLTLPAAPVQRLGAIERCGIADRVEQAGAAAPAVMTPTVR